jgi:hypothetical protein
LILHKGAHGCAWPNRQGTFKVDPGRPHGVCQTEPDMVNADLLAFARGQPLPALAAGGRRAA